MDAERSDRERLAKAGRGAWKHLAAGRCGVDELIAERRAESALESAEADAT
jgi:hypothetical protein